MKIIIRYNYSKMKEGKNKNIIAVRLVHYFLNLRHILQAGQFQLYNIEVFLQNYPNTFGRRKMYN